MLIRAGEVEDGWPGIIAMREGDFSREPDGQVVGHEHKDVGDMGQRG